MVFNGPLGSNRLSIATSGMVDIISGTDQGWEATFWNLDTGDRHMDIQGDAGVVGWDFSLDGRYFAVSQKNGTVSVWDVDRKERLFDWQAPL